MAREITHDLCVNLSAGWLANRKSSMDELRCKVILKEMVGHATFASLNAELPDVLGIWDSKHTVNIECKISRSDFLADKNKHHNHPTGNYKLFACPYGMIKEDEVPKDWGLLYVNMRGGKLIKTPLYQKSEVDVTPIVCDIIINGCNAGVLTSKHKKRHNRMWDGKAVVL